MTSPSYSAGPVPADVRFANLRPVFDRDQSGWRAHTQRNPNSNTSGTTALALRTRASVSQPHNTAATSSQAPWPLRFSRAENVGPTTSTAIPFESTMRTPVRQGRADWASSSQRTASNRGNWRGMGGARARPSNSGHNGYWRSTATYRSPGQNIRRKWMSQNEGTLSQIQTSQNLLNGNRNQTLGWDYFDIHYNLRPRRPRERDSNLEWSDGSYFLSCVCARSTEDVR